MAKKIIGIDLGTTNSVVSFMEGGKAKKTQKKHKKTVKKNRKSNRKSKNLKPKN